ncbi:LuxR C-terminal-related transcriptional regulator [Methylibium petroleiphilum]|uniref:LuxR C-terminal-related transcriptional regulator n=1 Tax=Methylibium petroleiphilum TaxID=105560 RepID=UPI001AD2FC37|nr:LuxR C-terminal-related transcriptional regulator [Methylibium petroleiphilum]MBN9204090.1 AAA family ATPase [Methylibium petroleiphilum]
MDARNAPTAPSASHKYRIPRARRDAVPRPALLAHTLERAADARLVLVQAPAGFGKTTLLVQLAAALSSVPGAQVVWVSLDAEDNDANRLFAALFGALAALELPWAVPPATVLAQLQDASPAARTALGLLIDALGAWPDARITLVLDDLHHVTDAAALQLLDTLIARAPPELCLFIGSRVAPPLSLARWRAGGELVELGLEDLQFDLGAAQALCRARGLAAPSDEALQAALARTHGWVAGLQLMLGSERGRAGGPPALTGPAAHRHLFDYFAQEVLAGLPPALQPFVLHASVLPELSPALCQAVTGRADARAVLDDLFNRQLFLSALDDAVPVLRFHDLFRDFLRGELERREPGRAAALHALAAAAETRAERAVPHWLAAGRGSEALAALRQMADGLLAVGGTHRLERWLEQLPPDWREPQADAALLRGLCAWSRWDWVLARDEFQRSHDAYARQGVGRERDRYVALGMLGACHNALGELARAEAVLDAAAQAPLPPALQVAYDSLRAWHGVARGDGAAVLAGLAAMADNAARAPEARYPNIVDMSYGHFTGLPGTRPLMERLRRLCRGERPGDEVQLPSLDAWLAFWHGEPDAARSALHDLLQRQRQLPGDVMLSISALHLRSLHLAAQGHDAEALAAIAQVQDAMTAGFSQGWRRTYAHVQARIHWRSEDADGLAALLPDLARPRSAREWPVLDTGAALVQGQHALLRGDWTAARALLERAAELQRGGRLPVFMGDARFALAVCRAGQGELDAAAVALDEVLCEAVEEDGFAGLLLEPPGRLQALWQALASRLHCPSAAQARLRRRLAAWQAEGAPAAVADAVPPDEPLSAREREVLALLAEGQSNKLIARALGLSLHTVKRHVANILTKLALDSRTQAAAYWHRR